MNNKWNGGTRSTWNEEPANDEFSVDGNLPATAGEPMATLSVHYPRPPQEGSSLRSAADMSAPISRPELEARLETVEARADARSARIEAQIDKAVEAARSAARASDDLAKITKEAAKSTVLWLVGTGVAVVLGIAAFNATMLSNMVASFESGKNTAALVDQVGVKLDALQRRLDASAPSPAASVEAPPKH